jgi:hypothetical protein
MINDIDADSSGVYAFLGTTDRRREFKVVDISVPERASIVQAVDIPDENVLNGIAYSSMLDIVVGASTSLKQEIVIFEKN